MSLFIKHLGLQEYAPCYAAMQVFTAARTPETPDELWVVEHPPVYTLGLAGDATHLLRRSEIPLVQVDRGGQITYHGPGQVVIYLLLDLRRRRLFVRELVQHIEQAIIDVLASNGITAQRKTGAPGVYVQLEAELAKIAALGIKVRNQCTYHGLALNVAMDLQPFSDINPCGYAGMRTIDMRTLGVQASQSEVAQRLCQRLTQLLAASLPTTQA